MIGQEPPEIAEKMWPGKARHLVPNDSAGCPGGIADQVRQIFNVLSIEMNLRIGIFREAFELFGNATLSAVAAIQKGRYHREAQISGSNWPESDLLSRRFRRERKGLWVEAEITRPDRATDKHSISNLRTTGFLQKSRGKIT